MNVMTATHLSVIRLYKNPVDVGNLVVHTLG